MNTFFRWCEATRKIRKAFTSTIEKIDPRRMPNYDQPPVILNLVQIGRLFKATLDKDPGLIPYYVSIHPTLQAWLALKGDYAYQMEEEQDCIRHTFASHSLPVFGAEKTKDQLGHGDYDMLFKHYRALVRPEEAAKFWEITPDVIKNNKLQDIINRPAQQPSQVNQTGSTPTNCHS